MEDRARVPAWRVSEDAKWSFFLREKMTKSWSILLDDCTRAPYLSYDEPAPQYETMISMPERPEVADKVSSLIFRVGSIRISLLAQKRPCDLPKDVTTELGEVEIDF
jgi:hypothetical protein